MHDDITQQYETLRHYFAKLTPTDLRRLRGFAAVNVKRAGVNPLNLWLLETTDEELERPEHIEPTLPRLPVNSWSDGEFSRALLTAAVLARYIATRSEKSLRDLVAGLVGFLLIESSCRFDATKCV